MRAPAADDGALRGVLGVPHRLEWRQVPVEVVAVHQLPARGLVGARHAVPDADAVVGARGHDGVASARAESGGGDDPRMRHRHDVFAH